MPDLPFQNLLNLESQTAIVTGGAVGIGAAIVHRLANAHAKVVIADINAEAANICCQQLVDQGLTCQTYILDISNPEQVQQLVQHTVHEYGGVDILVNNAGIYPPKSLSEMELVDFQRVLAVNLEGVFLTTKYVSQQMISQGRGGKIINITSIDALHPSMVGLAHYDASKHGLWGFTKNVALELAKHKILVNAVAPGGILTPGVQAMQSGGQDAGNVENFLSKIPMHRLGDPDEIGKVVLFLASEMSSYMTGSQIVVDGGALLS